MLWLGALALLVLMGLVAKFVNAPKSVEVEARARPSSGERTEAGAVVGPAPSAAVELAVAPRDGGASEEKPASKPAASRTLLEHPPRERFPSGLRPITRPAQAPTGLKDRRADAGPRGADVMEALQYGLDTIEEDIKACLRQWDTAEKKHDASAVTVAFQITGDGLKDSWLVGADEMPFGPRSCFANAVYGVDWSNIADAPVEITARFTRDESDAGVKTP